MAGPLGDGTGPGRADGPGKRGPAALLVVAAGLLTITAAGAALEVLSTYIEDHSYFYDAATYLLHNARLHTRLAEEGRLTLAAHEWLENDRFPLRTVPLILIAPGLLAHPFGHLATALPALFILLFLLGWTVYQRTGFLLYALACMALFVAARHFYQPNVGLAAYWLDSPAAFLTGAAALALLNSRTGQSYPWLAAFAGLASATVLCRYAAGVFVFFQCAPVLVAYLCIRWRRERTVRSVLAPVLLIGGIVAALTGYYLVSHFESNRFYYSQLGYGASKGVPAATYDLFKNLVLTAGLPVLGILAALFVAQLAWFGTRSSVWFAQADLVWLAGAHLLFMAVILQTVGHPLIHWYALAPLFLLASVPLPWHRAWSSLRVQRAAAFLLLVSLGLLVFNARAYQRAAGAPSPHAVSLKELDVALADELDRQGSQLVWNTYFDDRAWLPSLEAYYRTGHLPLPAGHDLFTLHETFWKAYYPGLGPEEVSRRVFERTCRWVDVAVVVADPAAADRPMSNAITSEVARYLAQTIARDPRWQRIFTIDHAVFGKLVGYRNLTSSSSGAYRHLLRADAFSVLP